MMNPMPRRMTANITSVKVKPRRKEDLRLICGISFTSNQRAVEAIDDQGDGVLVDPVFFILLGSPVCSRGCVAWKLGCIWGFVVEAAAAELGIVEGEVVIAKSLCVENHQAETRLRGGRSQNGTGTDARAALPGNEVAGGWTGGRSIQQ